MARQIRFEGRVISVPDDATDQEVAAILAPPAAAPEPVGALNPMSESTLSTAAAQLQGRGGFWEGLKAGGRVVGEKAGELFDKTGIGPFLQGMSLEPPGGFDKDPSAGVVESREVAGALGELFTPDLLTVAGVGAGAGKVGQVVRSLGKDIALGTGKGLEHAGQILKRSKAGVSGDLTDPVPGSAASGLLRRGIEPPGASGGLRPADDPLTAAERAKQPRRLASGAVIRPYEEGGITIKKSDPPKTAPYQPPFRKPHAIISAWNDTDMDTMKPLPGVKGPAQGLPLPDGSLKTSKELVGEAGSKKVRATPYPAADPMPSVAASQPMGPLVAPPLPTAPMDEVAERLARAHGLAPRDPRLVGIVEALDVPVVKDKSAALRGSVGALLGNASAAGASEGEDDDTITRRLVYTLAGLGLGIAAFPVAKRVIAAWRGRPIPKVVLPDPTQGRISAGAVGKVMPAGGDLKSSAQIAQETYGSVPVPKASPVIEQALAAAPPPPPPATIIPILDLATGEKMAKFTEALFIDGKFKYVQGDVPLSDQLLEILAQGYASPQTINNALRAAGMNHAELKHLLGLSRGTLSESARHMAEWSAAARSIQKALMKDPDAKPIVSILARTRWVAHDFLYNMMAMWRGALTSHIATAVRNVWVSAGRSGMQSVDSVFDAVIRKSMGKTAVSPLEGLEMWGRVFKYQGTKEAAQAVLQFKPTQWRKLYGDILEAQEAARNSNVGQAIGIMNWHNAIQEKFTRNVAFTTALDRELGMRGMDLISIIKNQQTAAIPLDAVMKSVDEALAFTFAKNPEFGTGWWHANKLMHQWWAVPFTPFPRFMYNTAKFYMEYTPFGLIDILRRNGGTTRDWAKQVTGALALGSAYLFRSSNVAGEKWYQVKVGDKTVDLRPFNPLAGFVFMAEAIRRFNQGEQPMPAREILEGIAGLNLRAGTGFALMDQMVDSMSNYGWEDFWQWEKIKQSGGETFGEWLGGFATPIQQLTDLSDQFIDEPYKMERKGNPMADPFLARMPVRLLPPAVNPMTDTTPQRHATALRFLGISVEGPRTAAEKEFQRHGMGPGHVMPRTGLVEWDRIAAAHMAMMTDAMIEPFVTTPNYQGLSSAQQRLALRQITAATREIAMEFAIRKNPKLAGEAKMMTMPSLERKVLTELFGEEIVRDPGSIEVVRFLRSNLPDHAAFLKEVAKSIKQK